MYHKTLATLLSLVAVALASPTASCSANNCLRAVQASAFTTRHGTADCASYFLTTVTPATTTITATAYTTSTTTTTVPVTTTLVNTITNLVTVTDVITSTAVVSLLAKRFDAEALVRHPDSITLAPRQMTVAPSSIPAYASACSGSVRYSSACSCVGFTKSTTTAATPSTTTTTTSTITVTATVTSVQTSLATQTAIATVTDDITQVVTFTQRPQATPTFILQASGGGVGVNGQYAQVIDTGDGLEDDAIAFTTDPSAATPLHIDAAGHLTDGTRYANTDAGTTSFLFYFNTPAQVAASGYVYVTCSVLPTNALQCVYQSETMFQICGGMVDAGAGLVLGSDVKEGCTAVSLMAIRT